MDEVEVREVVVECGCGIRCCVAAMYTGYWPDGYLGGVGMVCAFCAGSGSDSVAVFPVPGLVD